LVIVINTHEAPSHNEGGTPKKCIGKKNETVGVNGGKSITFLWQDNK
jgi:hypothetical protein